MAGLIQDHPYFAEDDSGGLLRFNAGSSIDLIVWVRREKKELSTVMTLRDPYKYFSHICIKETFLIRYVVGATGTWAMDQRAYLLPKEVAPWLSLPWKVDPALLV